MPGSSNWWTCELCGEEFSNQLYEDHLRQCVNKLRFNLGNLGLFYKTLSLIEKHLGISSVVSYLNSFSLAFIYDFFCPHLEKEGPTFIPIEEMTDIILSGLTKGETDKKYYEEVIRFLHTLLDLLNRLVGIKGIDPFTAVYILSILNLFETIHEKNYDKYLERFRLNLSLKIFHSTHEKEIARCREITSRYEW